MVALLQATQLTCRATLSPMSDFDETEFLLSELLRAAVPVLSDSERAEVQHFVDVGEYGLALETLVDIYAEEKRSVSADVVCID